MSGMGKVKRVAVRERIPGRRAGGTTLDTREVGPIEIINIGVKYDFDGVEIVVPWAGVKWLELEADSKSKGRRAAAAADE